MQAVERIMAQPQIHLAPLQVQQLVLVHLPDSSRSYTLVPVPGVVVASGVDETMVRIRNLTGDIINISVRTNELVVR